MSRLTASTRLCCIACVACLSAACLASACDDEVQPSTARASSQQLPAAAAPKAPASPAAPAPIDGLERIDAASLREHVLARGRGTIVNVWASWCGSCRDEIPMLLKLREAFAAEGVDFLFVSADEPQDWPKAVKLMQDWGGPMPTFAVAGAAMNAFKQALHPSWHGAIPATFLFDATFKRRHFWEGPVYDHEVAPIVQGFLAGAAIDGDTRPALRGGAPP